jgi:hypothetical protein
MPVKEKQSSGWTVVANVEMAEAAERPPPHWSKTVDPEGPEMQALRAARLGNPLMREALEAGTRNTMAQASDEPEPTDESGETVQLPHASSLGCVRRWPVPTSRQRVRASKGPTAAPV